MFVFGVWCNINTTTTTTTPKLGIPIAGRPTRRGWWVVDPEPSDVPVAHPGQVRQTPVPRGPGVFNLTVGLSISTTEMAPLTDAKALTP